MSRDITQKELKHDELLDTAVDFGHWLEQNWRLALRWVGVVVGVVLVVLAAIWYMRHEEAKASKQVQEGIAAYNRSAESQFSDIDELGLALDTFENVATKGGSAGQLAQFYQGATLYRLGRFDEAIGTLEEHVTGADPKNTLTWAAQSMLIDALVQSGQVDRALELLNGFVDAGAEAGGYPVDQALIRIGRIEQTRGNNAGAREAWQRVVDEFPESAGAQEARGLVGGN